MAWAVMGSPVTSIYFRTFKQNGTPKPAKSRQIMGSPAVSVEFHGQMGGYILTNNSVAKILLNRNSSSAFIERFFSICGFIQDKRRAKTSIDLFKKRCLLRANIKILNELKYIMNE